MKSVIKFTLIYLFLVTFTAQAQSNSDILLEGMKLLDDASNKQDADRIMEAREILEQITADDSLAIWAHYYAAAASSGLANMITDGFLEGKNRDIAGHVNQAIDHLEAAVEIDPTFADGWVLLSTAYAQKISVRPLKVIGLSRKYNQAMSKAFELEPKNPRVVLIKAIMDYSLPGIAGGDKERAEQGYNEAMLLFADEEITHPFRPSWGHDQVYVRIGILYMDRGDLEDARQAFERALELNPGYRWVKRTLIPSLEKLESQTLDN
ncbi:MAG: tetratricopeptide repeat protein [Bacteroidetes bacterium]|nr:tetratricopeptide repeat protein [Bacteroidota bacterium]MCY4204834.1 tetratricopeptide repeat protein [Bacteroidota bacterium]